MSRFCLAIPVYLVFAAAGCGGDAGSKAQSDANRSAERLTPADLETFLSVVKSNGESLIPEFEPPEESGDLDYRLPAEALVAECGRRFRAVFDTRRQGDAWQRDRLWAQAFKRRRVSGADFAGLVRRVSCAIMRVRIDSRVDIERVIQMARSEVADLADTMNAIDETSESEKTSQDGFIRGQSALRLARLAALLEFAEMVRDVPAENCAVVRRFASQLKPLVPEGSHDQLLAELQALVQPPTADVVPAGHLDDAD
ncbi:MAG: hypothetical protein ACT4QC_11605 [Planctomycetaceae bacterium]